MRAVFLTRFTAILFAALLVATLTPASTRAAAGEEPKPPKDAPGHVVPDSYIVTLKKGVDPDKEAPGLAKGAGGHVDHVYEHALNGFAFKGSAKAAAVLAKNPNVRTVVPDRTLQATAETTTPGIERIRADHPTQPDAHDSGFTGAGVRVAILDTGIDLTHPDLVANIDAGLGKNCMGPGLPQDGHGHGTHVAGIIAAVKGNGLGVIGVAPSARLVPFKVLDDSGSGEWSNLICAVDILTGYATDADPSNDVMVANMSLGDVGDIGTCHDGGIREAICTSVAAGITYVAAAGNSTVDTSTFIPAAFPEVIAVSAMTDFDGEPGGLGGCLFFIIYCDDTLAEFSNYGSTVDVTAPGVQVYSTWTGGGYMTEDGTSMASPHVAGVAALVKAANPSLRPRDIEALLKATGECANGAFADADGSDDCVGKGERDNDPDGYGEPLVNALHAAQAASGWDGKPFVQITSPTDGTKVSGTVNFTATADDDHGVTKVEFFVNDVLQATDTNGSDGWSTTWNSGSVPAGLYTLKATATDTTNQTRSDEIIVTTDVQGSWVGTYGVDGFIESGWNGAGGDLAVLPTGASYTLEQGTRTTSASWPSPTTDVRALQAPNQSERRARNWYNASQVRVRLTFSAAYSGQLHVYAVDWDTTARRETITVNDGTTSQSVAITTAFNVGAWMHFAINVPAGGSLVITADRTGGSDAVLSGIFLGGAGAPPQPPPPPYESGVQGSWVGTYGVDGFIESGWNGAGGDLAVLPTGASYTLEQGTRTTSASWPSPTTDVRALQAPNQSERRARNWYNASQVRVRLTFSAAYSGQLHVYAVDWDTTARRETITVNDGTTSQSVAITTAFNVGAWMHFAINVPAGGSLVITADRTGGSDAVLSGIFLGGAGAPPQPPPPPYESGVQGSWVGTYGVDGFIESGWNGAGGDLAVLPTGASYTLEQGTRTTSASWPSPTTDVRALQAPNQSERRARNWYNASQVRVRLTFSAAYSGQLHVYAVDWDTTARRETITVNDGTTSQSVAITTAFNVGAWMHFAINVPAGGSLVITADRTGGSDAVLSGIFLGGAPSPATVPGAPTLTSATPGNGSVALAWTAPASNGGSAITGYVATASPGGLTCPSSGLGCTIAGLTNGVSYSFTVVAQNAVGPSAPSNSLSATPVAPATVPGAPTLTGATPGNGSVALAWTAPASNGGSPISGYVATASPGGLTCPSSGLGCTITGLTNGISYSFTVVAQNAVGPSAPSNSLSATPVAPATVPGAPTLTSATPGNGSVALAWTAPASNGGSAITGYVATASPGGLTCPSSGLGCTITGLTNGISYSFTVVAQNAVGPSAPSNSLSATPVAPATVPGAPTLTSATPGNGSVALAWTAPASNGGSPISGYVATASPGGLTCPSSGLGCTITGLTNGISYSFTVVAQNAVGPSAPSNSLSATPVAPATVPGAPTLTSATPGNGSVALAWTAPASNGGSAITGYVATASPGGLTCPSSGLGCTIAGLTNGISYSFTVVAQNAVGPSAPSNSLSATPVAPATVPGAPTLTSATPGNGSVALAWTAPASNGGSAITGYVATASPGGLTCPSSGLGCTITGLTNGISYSFTVVAQNAVGPSAPSNSLSATPVAPATVPGAPTLTGATPGNGSVALAWTAPASNGGSPISGYRIYRGTSSATKVLIATLGVATTYTDAGRTNGTTYFYQVSAVNAIGESARSNELSAKPATVPSAPRNFAAKPHKTRGVALSWLAPSSNGGSAVTGYRIYRSTTSGTETFLIAVGAVTSYQDTANTIGIRYYYKVTAVNSAGESPASGESNAIAK